MKKPGLTKTQKVAIVRVLDALKARACTLSHPTDAESTGGFQPEWADGGFAKALKELNENPRPLGLTRRSDRGWLMLILCDKDRSAVDAVVVKPLLDRLKSGDSN